MFFYRRKIFSYHFKYETLIKKIKPLQVHLHNMENNDKRTSLSASRKGSMTVEATVILPVLLCAFMGILLLAKVFMINQEMDTALLETARQVARKEYLFSEKGNEGASIVLVRILFQRNKKQGDAGKGITVKGLNFYGSEYREQSKEIYLKANYKIRIPLLLLGTWQIPVSTEISQKAWNGYAPSSGESSSASEEYVYVTEDGEVYHQDGQCYHLHITIHETDKVDKYYDGKTAYKPCEYCIHKADGRSSLLYIPEKGDCYHSNPLCGSLTRTVRYIKKEEAAVMRPCSHCCK